MNGFARGLFGLTILAGVCCANGLSGCATGTSIDGPASVPGEDVDSGSSTSMDDSGTIIPPDTDSGTTGGGKDAGTTSGKDSGGGPCAGEVVVNEVQSAGATASDEFVELYNPASCALSLTGYKFNYSAASGSAPLTYFVGTASHSIPAKGYFLLGGSGFTAPMGGKIDGQLTGGLAAAAGRVAILDGTGKVLDAVGYGTLTGGNTYVEKNAAPSPATNKSIGRKPDGKDTDDNAVDFSALASPSPGAAN